MLMSAELKGCVTRLIYFLDLLWVRYNCAKFHHCRICVTAHPWAAPKKPILKRVKGNNFYGKNFETFRIFPKIIRFFFNFYMNGKTNCKVYYINWIILLTVCKCYIGIKFSKPWKWLRKTFLHRYEICDSSWE